MFKRNFLKLLIVFVLSIVVVEQTYIPMAQAGMGSYVSNALSGSVSSVTTGQGGFYHAQGEDIYTLGYTRIRFNLTPGNTSLFTIEPPQFSMGCSGIDSMWGGFSMVSGAELEKIMQNIISIAIPFAFNMALGVLCKQCEAIMNQIEAIANKLNGLNFNSCRTAQAAAGVLTTSILNLNQSGGSNNNWLSSVQGVLNTTTGGNPNGTGTGGIIGMLNNFKSDIPSGSCSSSTTSPIQSEWNAISNCGTTKLKQTFQLGSVLRYIADRIHIGLTAGGTAGPTTGGAYDLIGVIRGSLIGDIMGYMSSDPSINGKPDKVRYFPVTSYSRDLSGNSAISTAFQSLLYGGNLSSSTISTKAYSDAYGANGTLLNKTELFSPPPGTINAPCFVGFYPLYDSMLDAIASSLFTSYTFKPAQSKCSPTPTTASSPISPSEYAQFISASQIPVIEVIKMAVVTDPSDPSPAIINQAAQVMAEGALADWMGAILNGINANIYSYKNLSNPPKGYMNALKEYQSQTKTVWDYFQARYKSHKIAIIALLKALKQMNHAWIRSLSSSGLMGNYNFSKHLQ